MTVKRLIVAASLAATLSCAAALAPAPPATAEPGTTGSTAVAAAQIPSRAVIATFPSGPPKPPQITCTAAFMIDAQTGEYLFSHNANARLPMASTTKIMTALLALEALDLNAKVTVSRNAVSTIGSKSGLVAGESLTVRQLIEALMVVSGNDASIAIAEAVSGSVSAFVEKMNARAKELGLTNTRFVNPCGLNHRKHFSSAKDLAFLTQRALRDPVFATIVDTIDLELPPIPPVPPSTKETLRKFDNQNELLKELEWVTGVKTGSTPYAKYCLVASGAREGRSVIAVVLGAKDEATRWKEARALLQYGISLYPRTVLLNAGELVAEIDVGDPLGRRVSLVANRPLVTRLSRNETAISHVTLTRVQGLPVKVGDMFGMIEFTVDGRSVGSVDLVAAQALERPPFATILNHLRRYGVFFPALVE